VTSWLPLVSSPAEYKCFITVFVGFLSEDMKSSLPTPSLPLTVPNFVGRGLFVIVVECIKEEATEFRKSRLTQDLDVKKQPSLEEKLYVKGIVITCVLN